LQKNINSLSSQAKTVY